MDFWYLGEEGSKLCKTLETIPDYLISSCVLGSVDSARPVAEDGGAEGPQQGHGPAGDHIVWRHQFTAPSSGQCQEGICELRANVFVDGTKWIFATFTGTCSIFLRFRLAVGLDI